MGTPLDIDKFALEEEWLTQASKFEEAADAYTNAHKIQGDLELDLKSLEARTALSVRAMPEDYGLEKATNDAVNETVTLDEEVIAARRAVLEAARDTEKTKNHMEAFRQRKSALENLCFLFRMSYYSEPTGNGGSRMKEHIQNRNQA